MSEMLANSYFISRNFSKALPYFEEMLQKGQASDKIKKKLLICYIAVGRIEDAFEIFHELVRRDPFIIINTDPYWDDCPCPEMVSEWEGNPTANLDEPRISLILGMLYLFCDVERSMHYLKKALPLSEYYTRLNQTIERLQQAKLSPKKSM